MFRLLASIILGFVMFRTAAAQQPSNPTRATLERAVTAYENFAVERSLATLDSVMLGRANLTALELANAHKYMGAGNAVLARPGVAVDHFVEALKLDPTTTLDPAKFSKTELSQFLVARQRWLSNMRRDSVDGMVRSLQLAAMRIGTSMPGATFYIDDVAIGPISVARFWYVPAGRPVALSIRAANCSLPWDTVMTIPVGQQVTIGRRFASGCKP